MLGLIDQFFFLLISVQIFALSALLVVAYVAAGCPEEDGDEPVYLPHPKYCNSFYQCSNGQAYLQTCAEGTQWNAELSVCDWADEVGCVDAEEEEVVEVAAPPPSAPSAPSAANFPRSN